MRRRLPPEVGQVVSNEVNSTGAHETVSAVAAIQARPLFVYW